MYSLSRSIWTLFFGLLYSQHFVPHMNSLLALDFFLAHLLQTQKQTTIVSRDTTPIYIVYYKLCRDLPNVVMPLNWSISHWCFYLKFTTDGQIWVIRTSWTMHLRQKVLALMTWTRHHPVALWTPGKKFPQTKPPMSHNFRMELQRSEPCKTFYNSQATKFQARRTSTAACSFWVYYSVSYSVFSHWLGFVWSKTRWERNRMELVGQLVLCLELFWVQDCISMVSTATRTNSTFMCIWFSESFNMTRSE